MPPKHSGRLHQRHRRLSRSRPPRQQRDRQALRAREHHSLALQPALRSRQLLSEKVVLCHKRCARTELPHHQSHESTEHRGSVSRGGGPHGAGSARFQKSSQDGCSRGAMSEWSPRRLRLPSSFLQRAKGGRDRKHRGSRPAPGISLSCRRSSSAISSIHYSGEPFTSWTHRGRLLEGETGFPSAATTARRSTPPSSHFFAPGLREELGSRVHPSVARPGT